MDGEGVATATAVPADQLGDTKINVFDYRERCRWGVSTSTLPVTLITGFLGSGKTTLVNQLLLNKHNLRVAAAVNDFADLCVDGQLVRDDGNADSVKELSSGCLCCTQSNMFEDAVYAMLNKADAGEIDYLIIEASGIADPVGVMQRLRVKCGRLYRVRLEGVVAVVDTDDLCARLRGQDGAKLEDLANKQLQCADVVLLNKVDLVGDQELSSARDYVTGACAGVRTIECSHCKVPICEVLGVETAPDPKLDGTIPHDHGDGVRYHVTSASDRPPPSKRPRPEEEAEGNHQHGHGHGHGHGHDHKHNHEHDHDHDHDHDHNHKRVHNHKHDHDHKHGHGHQHSHGHGSHGTHREEHVARSHHDQHGISGGYESIVFESTDPLDLPAFQEWLAVHTPPGMLRAKGYLHFAQDPPDVTWTFHYSGRRRFQCTSRCVAGQRRTQLVLIGRGVQHSSVLSSLRKCVFAPCRNAPTDTTAAPRVRSRVPGRLVAMPPAMPLPSPAGNTKKQGSAVTSSAPNLVTFRLSCCVEYGMDVETMERKGVSLAAANQALCEAVNYAQDAVLLTTVAGQDGRLGLRLAVWEGCDEELAWGVVETEAARVIPRAFAPIESCRCGW